MINPVCKNKNVLIIDSIRLSREMLKNFAHSIDSTRVDTSHRAPDIISFCENVDYDVILLGYDLGENTKNGQQILEELRVKRLISRHCAVIMITAEVSQSMVLAALEHKPDEYLTKPYTLNDISTRLERCLIKKSAMFDIYSAMNANDHNTVIDLCNKTIQKNGEYKHECLGIISRQYYELREYEKAKEIYKAYEGTENCQWAIIGLSKIALKNKDYSTAKSYLNAMIDNYPYYLSAYDWLAKTYELDNEPIEAERILEKAVIISPRSVPRLKNYAERCLNNQNYEKATNAYGKTHDLAYHSVHRKPENTIRFAEALLEYSDQLSTFEVRQLNKRVFKALKKMTIDFKGSELKVLSLLLTSRLHTKVNDTSFALSSLREAERMLSAEQEMFSPSGSLAIAKSLISLDKRSLAENLIDTLAQAYPDNSKLLADISALINKPVSDKNRIEAQNALEMGVELYNTGHYIQSIDKLNHALELFPYHLGIKLNLFQVIIISMEQEIARTEDKNQINDLISEFNKLSITSESFKRYKKLRIRYDALLEV